MMMENSVSSIFGFILSNVWRVRYFRYIEQKPNHQLAIEALYALADEQDETKPWKG